MMSLSMQVCVPARIYLFIIGLLYLQVVSKATCPGDGTVTPYVQINKPYDRNYSATHPLGFYKGVWYYDQQGRPNPCINVTASQASTRRLEIKVETVPLKRLCVKDQASDPACFLGFYTDCREIPADSIYIEFLCDSQCEEGDVNYWYRLTLSDIGEDPETFCFNTGSEYPSDLLQLPPGATFPSITTPAGKPTGQGTAMQPWALATVLVHVVVCSFLL